MEFRDLKKQYELYKSEIDQEINRVLTAGTFIGGEPVSELEKQLAQYVGRKFCVSCANGTDALQLALMCWNIGPGDAVFVPDFTFFSTAETVAMVGATPVMVDICEDTFNISPDMLESAICKTMKEGKLVPKVIIGVDLFGQPFNYDEVCKIADKYHLYILEDGAQGFGGKLGDRRACSLGDISTTSFFPAKPLGCYGDGGAIFTDNEEWKARISSLKVHGKGNSKYDNVIIGMNSRLDTIQAAVLKVKLSKLNEEIVKVNYWADLYTQKLKDYVKCPVVHQKYESSWAQYTILLENESHRERIQEKLRTKGVPTMIYYAKGMHQQRALEQYLEYSEGCPVTENVCKRCLSLPMHPYLSEEDITYVSDEIIRVICSI